MCGAQREGGSETVTNSQLAQLAQLRRYQAAEREGRILTPDGLRVICDACGRDPVKIGEHMLEVLARQENCR